MNKKEVQRRVLKDGKPLSLKLFTWDDKTKTFSSQESGLVIDFRLVNGCNFELGAFCVVKAGRHCSFRALYCCTFDVMSECSFYTGDSCVVIRRDFYGEVFQLEPFQHIKLNDEKTKGFVILDKKEKVKV